MTAQAGWYEDPGETGMLRYWSGEGWTDHRQPAPPAGAPVAVPVVAAPVVAAAVMQPFESQFTPQPQFTPQAQFTPTPQYSPTPQFAAQPQYLPTTQPQYEPPQFGQPPQQYGQPQYGQLPPVQQPGTYPPAAPESPFQHFLGEARSVAANPANQGLAEELGGAALAADGVVGFGAGRQGIGGAIKGMGLGLVFIVIGFLVMGYMGSQNSVGAGEKETSAVVTGLNSSTSTDSKGNTSTSCSPMARYTVGGKTYQATSNISISPCAYAVGQSVSVIYTKASPATAHVAEDSSTYWWLWAFPIIGGLAFFGSLWTFIKRAGSIAGGIALIVNGRKRRAASLQQR